MREIYRGNGFIIETNDSDEIFVKADKPTAVPQLRLSRVNHLDTIQLSYLNQPTEMWPVGPKTVEFHRT